MSFFKAYRCDACKVFGEVEDVDDSPPASWYQLMLLGKQGSWENENERHFCSFECVREYSRSVLWL